ncbi:5640_t:CDS:1, partial [Dentiscutata erythropus]
VHEDQRKEAYGNLIRKMILKSSVISNCIGNLSGYGYYIKPKFCTRREFLGIDEFEKIKLDIIE